MNAICWLDRTGWIMALLGLVCATGRAAHTTYSSAEPDLYPVDSMIPDDIGVKLRNSTYRPGHAEFDRSWRRIYSKEANTHPYCYPSTGSRVLGNDYSHAFEGTDYGLRAWFVDVDNSWRTASYVGFDICWSSLVDWSEGAQVTIYGDDIEGNEIVLFAQGFRPQGAYTPFRLFARGMKWLKIVCWDDPAYFRQNAFSIDAFSFVNKAGVDYVLDPDNPIDAPGGMDLTSDESLLGTGTVHGDLTNGGTVSPGFSPGRLAVNGNYRQTMEGLLEIDLAGPAEGQFDVLEVTGTAVLSGTLKVILDGYQPALDQAFAILTHTGHEGGFDHVVVDGAAVGWSFDTTYTSNAVMATAVFDPTLVRLTMAVSPPGAGTTTPPVGFVDVARDEPQEISATTGPGATFVNWTVSGDALVADPDAAATQVTLGSNTTVTANFLTYALVYTVDHDEATITGYSGAVIGHLVIPSEIDGYPVVAIGNWVFYECNDLTGVTIPNGVATIGEGAFYNCRALTAVAMSASVTALGNYAFENCASLTSLTIPGSVTNVGTAAFEYCGNLARIYFTGDAPAADWSVFQGASSATVYYLPHTTGWESTFAGRPAVLWNPLLGDPTLRSGPPDRFGFVITGTTDIPIAIEAAADLPGDRWIRLDTTTLVGGTLDFADEDATNYPARLYRIAAP